MTGRRLTTSGGAGSWTGSRPANCAGRARWARLDGEGAWIPVAGGLNPRPAGGWCDRGRAMQRAHELELALHQGLVRPRAEPRDLSQDSAAPPRSKRTFASHAGIVAHIPPRTRAGRRAAATCSNSRAVGKARR